MYQFKKTVSLLFSTALVAASTLSLSSCGDDDPTPAPNEKYAGAYTGEMAVAVGGQFTYTADVDVTVLAKTDETLTIEIPSYGLPGTMMGDLTLGSLTISNLTYDATKEAYTRSYGGQGLTRQLTAMNGNIVTIDGFYPLNEPSQIEVHLASDGTLTLTNDYRLGEMPFSLSAKYTGRKK